MDKNYYDILGIKQDATDKQIKSAFKKLSIKYHPDKQAGKTDEEKAEAEAKFKEINEAYQTLSDPKKRQIYDMDGDEFNISSQWPADDFFDRFNPFGHSNFYDSNAEQIIPGNDIRMNVPLTLEEIYNGCKKTVVYERDVRCAACHGDGGTGKKMCPHCHGTGWERNVQHTPFGIISQQTTCSHCHGTKFVIDHICKTCGGTGFTKVKETLELNFPAGIQNGNGLRVVGKGAESKDKKGPNGNFIAVAIHNYDTDKYVVEGNDVLERVTLPYYDLMLGTEYTHTFPDGRTKKINIESCTKEGKVIKLYKDGINGEGDYYLEFHYEIPTELSDEERKVLENIKVDKLKQTMQ